MTGPSMWGKGCLEKRYLDINPLSNELSKSRPSNPNPLSLGRLGRRSPEFPSTEIVKGKPRGFTALDGLTVDVRLRQAVVDVCGEEVA